MRPGSDMMGTMPMGKLIAKMSIPLMISMLIQSLYNIVDGIFVGKLNPEALIAIGLAFPIQMLMIGAANGLGVGMNALISQRFGRGERELAGKAAGNVIFLLAILTVVSILFGLFGCRAYLEASNSNGTIIAYGMDYLQIVTIFCPGIFYVIFTERLLQVTGKTTLSMITQASGAVVNIILDPILIFGLLGAPALGVAGAAVATVVGQFSGLLLGAILHLNCNPELQVRRADLRLDQDALQICRVGLPVTITMSMSSVMVFFMNKILDSYVQTLAVFTAYFRLQSFLFMPTNGMVQGLIPIIGYNYGARNGVRVRQAIVRAALAALCIMVAGLLVSQIIPGPIIGLFESGENPELIAIGVRAMRITSWVFPIAGVALVCSNLFQGMGTGLPGMLYGLGRQCVVLIPAAWFILQVSNEQMIWFAFWISELLTAAVIAVVFRYQYRKRVSPLLQEEKQG